MKKSTLQVALENRSNENFKGDNYYIVFYTPQNEVMRNSIWIYNAMKQALELSNLNQFDKLFKCSEQTMPDSNKQEIRLTCNIQYFDPFDHFLSVIGFPPQQVKYELNDKNSTIDIKVPKNLGAYEEFDLGVKTICQLFNIPQFSTKMIGDTYVLAK